MVRNWRFDVVAAKPTTILAFMFLHCWFFFPRSFLAAIAGLPDVRWVSRTVAWRPRNIRKRGAPFRMWHSAAETFCRWKGIANWQATAMNTQDWYKHTSDFVPLSSKAEAGYVRFQLCKCLCLKWATRANAPLVYRFHSFTHL